MQAAGWKVMDESAYDITFNNNVLVLNKKEDAAQTFDDGVMFKIGTDTEFVHPKHISFYCKTDKDSTESCNFRLFRTANEKETEKNKVVEADDANGDDEVVAKDKKVEKIKVSEIKRAETAVFFRFGYNRHFKINYNYEYINMR